MTRREMRDGKDEVVPSPSLSLSLTLLLLAKSEVAPTACFCCAWLVPRLRMLNSRSHASHVHFAGRSGRLRGSRDQKGRWDREGVQSHFPPFSSPPLLGPALGPHTGCLFMPAEKVIERLAQRWPGSEDNLTNSRFLDGWAEHDRQLLLGFASWPSSSHLGTLHLTLGTRHSPRQSHPAARLLFNPARGATTASSVQHMCFHKH
ncbi:hypothetical protein L1887_50217 [Cichorium endivia]|nr:hypothetical protein L1887_50217 [Cichorium endivia]